MGQSDSGKDPGNVFPLPGKTPKALPDVVYWHPSPTPLDQDAIVHGVRYTPKVKNEHASCGGANMMVPLLKHWTALPALSYFLTNAMHIRETSRRIVVPSTFKPPPRVTLPDSKRDSWLKDLADPKYPLRKLSRTVPGGLTGRTLLQLCYEREVPLFRSIWLIKCIGANELRTIKRKLTIDAQAGAEVDCEPEALYMTEWTNDVLKFVNETINSSEIPDWPRKLTFAFDLFYALKSESLIDEKLAVEWVLDQFGPSIEVSTLPCVIYLCYRLWPAFIVEPTAVKLAKQITLKTTSESLSPSVLESMDALLLKLFSACPDAFVQPDVWPSLERQLKRGLGPHTSLIQGTGSGYLAGAIKDLRERNAALSVAPRDEKFPAEWLPAVSVGDILTNFTVPYSIPELVNDLKALKLPISTLFSSLFTWTLRRASSRAVHLCLAVCQQLAACGSHLEQVLVDFLMHELKPSQCTKTLFILLGWLYKSDLFCVDKYFRRLIASGTMHIDTPVRTLHLKILQNLAFSFMGRTLCTQALMLLRENELPSNDIVLELADQVDFVYGQQEPQAPEFPQSLLRDQELRLSNLIYERFKKRFLAAPEKFSLLVLTTIVDCLDKLDDKYTLYKVVWLTLSNATYQELYVYAHSISLQYLYFFVCMRVSNTLVQVVYARRGDFVLSNEQSFENSNIVRMLRQASKDNNSRRQEYILDLYLHSLENLHAHATMMTPDSIEDDFIFGHNAVDLLLRALSTGDRAALLRLRSHYARSINPFMEKVRDWLAEHVEASTDFIVWCIANSCLVISDVYNCLIDKQDSKLYDIIFAPTSSFQLDGLERVYLSIIRQKFTLLSPTDEVLYILSKVTDGDKLDRAITMLMSRIRFNSDRCSTMLFEQIPDSEVKVDYLKRSVAQQIGLQFEDSTAESRFLHLLEVCNAFNAGFCQIGMWLNFRNMPAAEISHMILGLVKSGYISKNTQSWQVLFQKLDRPSKLAIRSMAEIEFLDGPIPHPSIDHLLGILNVLEAEPADGDKQELGLKLMESIDRIVQVCKLRCVSAEEIRSTILLILKLSVVNCLGGPDDPTQEETRQIILPTIVAMFTSLQRSPLVEENAELLLMVSDCLRLLTRQDDTAQAQAPPPYRNEQSALEGLVLYSSSKDLYSELNLWPFDMIEETANGPGNDAPLDLARFETYIDLKNTS